MAFRKRFTFFTFIHAKEFHECPVCCDNRQSSSSSIYLKCQFMTSVLDMSKLTRCTKKSPTKTKQKAMSQAGHTFLRRQKGGRGG